MLRVKPSPAYRGWHGASRGGCGGEPVRFIGLPGKTIGPTSVSPKGLPPCSSGMTATGSHGYFYSLRGAQPQGEGFSQKPLPSTPNDRTLPQSRASPCQPPLGGGQGPGQNLWPLPPLIRHGLRPVTPFPYTPGGNASLFLRIEVGASGHAAAPTTPTQGIPIPRLAGTNSRFPSASGAIFGTPGTPGGLRRKTGRNGSFPSGGTIHGPPRCPGPPAGTSSACS